MRAASVCRPSAIIAAAALWHPPRCYSEARTSFSGSRHPAWPSTPGEAPSYPDARSRFPGDKPVLRKTHTEWKYHHGHGGRYGTHGVSRELADFEYADGTPSSVSPRRFAWKHHQDHLLHQLIRAGATVERMEAEGLLPAVPGTAEQRDWDPAIPLFLEDLDETGRPPQQTSSSSSWPHPPASPSHSGTGAAYEKVVDGKYAESQTPINLANKHEGETLEPNTMFATFDPSAFVDDRVGSPRDERRPHWSRRRWALSDSFMVPKSPKPKNTIKDE